MGHDNNRDWYIFSQPETRATISKLHNVWHPHIVYDVHQQGTTASRMFIPPWLDPAEPNVDPILLQHTNVIGTAMAADLTRAGKTGISILSSYDFWTPSRHYQAFHGGIRILTESAERAPGHTHRSGPGGPGQPEPRLQTPPSNHGTTWSRGRAGRGECATLSITR